MASFLFFHAVLFYIYQTTCPPLLGMWASLIFPKWAWSCSSGHPASVTLRAQLEGHPGVQSLDPLGTFSPHLSLQGAGAKSQPLPPAWGAPGTLHLSSPVEVQMRWTAQRNPWFFVRIWLILSAWVNKVLSALPNRQGVKQTTLLKNLPSHIPKTGHCPSLSRVWLVFICAIKLLYLWLYPKSC